VEIPAIHGVFLYLLIIGGVALLAGAWLVRRGWLPRRRGRTPHCRRCNYILTGITTDRCPECGTTLGPQTTITGERHRRPLLGSLGLLLALLGLATTTATLTSRFREIDWYKYRPTSWVIADLRSSDPLTQSRAWDLLWYRINAGTFDQRQRGTLETELVRLAGLKSQSAPDPFRYLNQHFHQLSTANQTAFYKHILARLRAGDDASLDEFRMEGNLSSAQEQEITEVALAEFEAPTPSRSHGRLMEVLRDQAEAGRIAEDQQRRIMARVNVKLSARPTGVFGQPLPCQIEMIGELNEWPHAFEVVGVQIDHKSTSAFRTTRTLADYYEQPHQWLQVDPIEPGHHTLDVIGRVNLFDTLPRGVKSRPPGWNRGIHLTAQFDAFPAGTLDGLTWQDSPSLAKSLQDHIVIRDLASTDNDKRWLLRMTLDNLPADISFEVVVRFGDAEISIGEIAGVKGETSTHGIFNENPLRDLEVDKVDILLRSNPHPALQTINVLHPWKGTLVYRNVPVVGENE